MRITLLGTGTPAPSPKRASSGYLIEVGKELIVMDHGPDAHRRLLETGKRATEVTHAFFSHLHYDHCMDYPRLVLQRWDMGAGRIPELKVYGPAPIRHMTELLFAQDGVFGPDIDARVNHRLSLDIYAARGGTPPRMRPDPQVTEVVPGDVIEGSGWQVTVGEATHVQPYLACLAFRLDSREASMCYSGDSGGVSEDIIKLAEGCDVLIHMTHFRTGEELSEAYRQGCGNHIDTAHVARRAGVKTLVVTHVLARIDRPGVREQMLYEMKEILDGMIIWGEDLMEIPVGDGGARVP